MSVSRRYQPSHPRAQTATYGIDVAPMLPAGMGIITVLCDIRLNTTPPQADGSMEVSNTGSRGRMAWATIAGGTSGQDYLITWTLTDNAQNTWIISTLLLCAATS